MNITNCKIVCIVDFIIVFLSFFSSSLLIDYIYDTHHTKNKVLDEATFAAFICSAIFIVSSLHLVKDLPDLIEWSQPSVEKLIECILDK